MKNIIPRAVVGALIFNKEGKVFLMRSSGKYGDQWIIPGGKVDFGETIEEALIREIREETNLKIENIKFKGVRELIELERHFIFLEHTAIAMEPTNIKLNSESTEYRWLKKAELNSVDIAKPTLELINEHWDYV